MDSRFDIYENKTIYDSARINDERREDENVSTTADKGEEEAEEERDKEKVKEKEKKAEKEGEEEEEEEEEEKE